MIPEKPRVSIGVPVRNGGVLLEEALELLVRQTYTNLEIVISDNNSSDQTVEICKRYVRQDDRITYYRQDKDIPALENFRFVVEQATGDYFMWAAHDDRRSLNYVEVLLEKMLSSPRASLVFSDIVKFSDHSKWRQTRPIEFPFEFDIEKEDFREKIINSTYIRAGYTHIYGLLRRQLLLDYNWTDVDYGPDKVLIFYLSCRGSFVRAKGACFYCYKPAVGKSLEERTIAILYRKLKPFPKIRLEWACAKAACLAEQQEGRRRNFLFTFLLFLWRKRIKRIRKTREKLSRFFRGK